MAKRKQPFKTYCVVQAALVTLNVALCLALILLRNRCLNARTDEFVEFYCLSDNRTRALVSFVLAILIFNVAASLVRAVKSFRTYRMISGINEGVFVAILSGFRYRIRAVIKQPMWAAAILAVMLFELVPPFWQTITNYAITTELVFVKVPGSTAAVYTGNLDYGKGLDNLIQFPRLLGAEAILPSIATFSNPQISVLVNGGVQTSIVRDAVALNITSSHSIEDFSFRYTDVVATVLTSSCATRRHENVSFPDDGGSYVTKAINGRGVSVKVHSSFAIENSMSSVLNTEKVSVTCFEKSSCDMTVATCKTHVSLAKELVIYTSSNRKVKSVQTVDANVDINLNDFVNITSALVGAPERIAVDILSETQLVSAVGSAPGTVPGSKPTTSAAAPISLETFLESIGNLTDTSPNNELLQDIGLSQGMKPSAIEIGVNYVVDGIFFPSRGLGTGLFSTALENELHARVCSAVATALTSSFSFSLFSWKKLPSYQEADNALPPEEIIDLFTVIPQAYMPVYYVWTIAAFFIMSAVFLAILDIASFSKSVINVKEGNELGLIDNIGTGMNAARSLYQASNDTDKQEMESFGKQIYMRVENTGNPRLVVEYSDTPDKPDSTTEYF